MRISTEIGSATKHVGEERAVELVARAGFDAWDFSMCAMFAHERGTDHLLDSDHPLRGAEPLKFARRLRQIGLDNGIVCNQSHAPFPVRIGAIRDWLRHALECTAEAGGSICVIHPNNNLSAEENAEMYAELLPFARGCGVRMATENMWNKNKETGEILPAACSSPKSFLDHIRAVNDPYLVACVDIGHTEMKGVDTSAVEMLRALGPFVQAPHIHDNDKINDSHQIPFSMAIDFAPIAAALREIDYRGYFTLECSNYLKEFDADMVEAGLLDLAQAARKFADMFEA